MKTTRRTWFARLAALFGVGLAAPRLAESGTWRFEPVADGWGCTSFKPAMLDEELLYRGLQAFQDEYDAYARGDHLKQ